MRTYVHLTAMNHMRVLRARNIIKKEWSRKKCYTLDDNGHNYSISFSMAKKKKKIQLFENADKKFFCKHFC